jgi:C-terminal processing protease CtpA/Prc
MIRIGRSTVFASLAVVFPLLLGLSSHAQSPASDFKEVYDLVREHLTGVNEKELNRIAVDAFVAALNSKVSLSDDSPSATNTSVVLVSKSVLFEGGIGYFRVKRVEEGLDKRLTDAYQKLATNNLNGMVLDLRYATGQNYPAAAAVADLFVKKERPLMDWGKGLVRATEKNEAITIPAAVLVNAKTAGAAEALAAVLRETGTALILGNKTAGQAMVAQEYPLKEGGYLRIASGPIQLADGSALSTEGVKPDIAVEVSPEDEKAYYADAFGETAISNRLAFGSAGTPSDVTNRNRRTRLNEAELVRERRDGFILDAEPPSGGKNTAEKPVVRDPVLARALDVLKGLAVIRQSHS